MGGGELMATIPSPRTWTNGEEVLESYLDTDVRDGWRFFTNPPRVKVYNSTGQTIASGAPSNTADTLATWDTDVYDTDGMHNPASNASRLNVVTAGAYQVVCHINWAIDNQISDATHGSGNRYLAIKLNAAGSTTMTGFPDTSVLAEDIYHCGVSDAIGPVTSHCSFQAAFSVNDYIEVILGHSSVLSTSTIVGGAASRTFFAMRWIGTS